MKKKNCKNNIYSGKVYTNEEIKAMPEEEALKIIKEGYNASDEMAQAMYDAVVGRNLIPYSEIKERLKDIPENDN